MHRYVTRVLAIALITLAFAVPARAQATSEVTVELSAHRVIQKNGKEVLESAEKARPGEVVEYRAACRNTSSHTVKSVAATLPVPAGMEYQAGSAEPRGATASLDGKTFDVMPLKRKERLADGREVVREVPVSEYRYLRWTIASLDARAEKSVRARLRVTPLAVADAIQK